MCSYKKRKKRKKWRRRSRSSDGFGATFRVHCSVKKARCLRPDIVYSFLKRKDKNVHCMCFHFHKGKEIKKLMKADP